MRTSLRRWLLHRREPKQATEAQRVPLPTSPTTAMITYEWRKRLCFDKDLEEDPSMCEPRPGLPTAHITREIDQGATVAVWDDERRTFTMETQRVKI